MFCIKDLFLTASLETIYDRVLRARYFENHSKGFPKLSFKNYLQKIKYDRLQSYPPPNKIVLLVTVLADNFIVSVVE